MERVDLGGDGGRGHRGSMLTKGGGRREDEDGVTLEVEWKGSSPSDESARCMTMWIPGSILTWEAGRVLKVEEEEKRRVRISKETCGWDLGDHRPCIYQQQVTTQMIHCRQQWASYAFEDKKKVRGSKISHSTQIEASCNENLIQRWREETRANPSTSMGKRMGTTKPLAQSSAMSDT